MSEKTTDPRRRVVVNLKIGADSWDEVRGVFRHLETELVTRGRLSKTTISGGYSSGFILETDEDETITHDSWAAENDAYVRNLRKEPTP